jgi:hypothetical protein
VLAFAPPIPTLEPRRPAQSERKLVTFTNHFISLKGERLARFCDKFGSTGFAFWLLLLAVGAAISYKERSA